MLINTSNALQLLKILFNVIISKTMHLSKKRNASFRVKMIVQLNKKIKCNIIKKQFVVINKLKIFFSEFLIFLYMNKFTLYCYETYYVRFKFVDDWQKNRVVKMIFYSINKKNSNLIINIIKLRQKNVKQN